MTPADPYTGWRLRRLAIGALASFLQVGCSSGSAVRLKGPDAGAGLTWPDVMSSWSSAGPDSSLYSLSVFSEPPDGMFVRGVSYARPVEATCQTFRTEQYLQRSSDRDDWILFLMVSSYVPTRYQIIPNDSFGTERTAQILVKHVVHGKEIERHTGLAGTVEVTAVPSTAQDQIAGATFVIQGSVEFSDTESLQQGCSVGGAVDGTKQESTCSCLGADGTSFSCSRGVDETSCCIDRNASRRTFTIAVSSVPCADACLTTSMLLRSFCTNLGASSSSL